jgi:hypothetical protein
LCLYLTGEEIIIAWIKLVCINLHS